LGDVIIEIVDPSLGVLGRGPYPEFPKICFLIDHDSLVLATIVTDKGSKEHNRESVKDILMRVLAVEPSWEWDRDASMRATLLIGRIDLMKHSEVPLEVLVG
jgi:hypothetical protein